MNFWFIVIIQFDLDQRCQSELPIRLRRSRILINYLKSPSPRRQTKQTHCQFCSFEAVNAQILERHLNSSKYCCQSYLLNFKTTSILPILVSKFNCLFCEVSRTKLVVHLRKEPSCQTKYYQKFNVNSVQEVIQIIRNQKKKISDSRSAGRRRLEYEVRKERKAILDSGRSIADLINNFRKVLEKLLTQGAWKYLAFVIPLDEPIEFFSSTEGCIIVVRVKQIWEDITRTTSLVSNLV